MLGPPKPRRLDQPIAVSLEDLIPRDNFYRHLEAKLDLSLFLSLLKNSADDASGAFRGRFTLPCDGKSWSNLCARTLSAAPAGSQLAFFNGLERHRNRFQRSPDPTMGRVPFPPE